MTGLGAMPIIEVADVDASFAFYRDKAGFQGGNAWRDDDGTATFAIAAMDKIWIGLRRRHGAAPANNEEWAAYLYVDDVNAHHALATRTGVDIVYALEDQFYGCRDYTIRDPDGHLIAFGQELGDAPDTGESKIT